MHKSTFCVMNLGRQIGITLTERLVAQVFAV